MGYYPNYQPNVNQGFYPGGNDERIWVQNENAAEAYLMAPSSFVRLWDANKNVFYEKRSDATGRPLPLEVYEYTHRKPVQAIKDESNGIDYQKEIEGILRRLDALERGSDESVKKSNDDDTAV